MKKLPSAATPLPGRLVKWGRWLQTCLLVGLLLLLFQRLNLLPPVEETTPATSVQRPPSVQQVNWAGR